MGCVLPATFIHPRPLPHRHGPVVIGFKGAGDETDLFPLKVDALVFLPFGPGQGGGLLRVDGVDKEVSFQQQAEENEPDQEDGRPGKRERLSVCRFFHPFTIAISPVLVNG